MNKSKQTDAQINYKKFDKASKIITTLILLVGLAALTSFLISMIYIEDNLIPVLASVAALAVWFVVLCAGASKLNSKRLILYEAAYGKEKDIETDSVILSVGHSARDTIEMLYGKGINMMQKPFSVGARIEHPQEYINSVQYGEFKNHPKLKAADYKLACHPPHGRGAYTFCMCPGGEVIAAASEAGGVVVNGMSNHARRGENSNSAVLASVFPSDYGASVEGAIEYQRKIEHAAFAAAGGDFSAPVETVGDFLAGATSRLSSPSRILPSYTRGGTSVCDLRRILPAPICEEMARGIKIFGKRISGFDAPDALLAGVETRTSSPVRILRDGARTACGADLVYPCGEGAGYAGGITSAALDGIKTALAIMARFAPDKK